MEETQEYIKKIKNKFSFEQIEGCLEKAKKLNVLVIGDTIIDHYVFVRPKGRAVKDPILSVEFKEDEVYAGGILVIANHISSFVNNVKVVTLIGEKNDKFGFIKKSLRKNVELKAFIKNGAPTIVKKRFIDNLRHNKLFKIEYMNDAPINEDLTKEVVDYLNEELPRHDLVVVGDFGHGFINEAIKRKLEEKSKFLAVNVQSNSANMGYNYFKLYKKMDFVSMDEQELRLPLLRRFEDLDDVIKEAYKAFNLNNFLITRGPHGSIFVNKGAIFKAPILISTVKDTVGAGDALFAITSLFIYSKIDNELVPFIANCAGGIAANIMGNKESITKEMLLDFIEKVFSHEMG